MSNRNDLYPSDRKLGISLSPCDPCRSAAHPAKITRSAVPAGWASYTEEQIGLSAADFLIVRNTHVLKLPGARPSPCFSLMNPATAELPLLPDLSSLFGW